MGPRPGQAGYSVSYSPTGTLCTSCPSGHKSPSTRPPPAPASANTATSTHNTPPTHLTTPLLLQCQGCPCLLALGSLECKGNWVS